MEKIERNRYLEKLIKLRNNGQVKIITGIRRCGKSFLLNTIYRDYLLHDGVSKDQIIMLDLDDNLNARYRNPMELSDYLRSAVADCSLRYSNYRPIYTKIVGTLITSFSFMDTLWIP